MSIFRKKKAVQEVSMAKPKKANRKRTERLCLGLTPEEKKRITDGAKESGMSRTDYILNAVEGNQIVVIAGLPQVCLELSRQGNSINQIARCLNQRGHVSHETIEGTCQECRHAYERLVHFIDYWDVKLKEMEEA